MAYFLFNESPDRRDDCMDAGGRAMQGAIAEESYPVAENKISPVVEMTRACHSDQREESCIMTLGDSYLEKRRQQGRAF